MKIAICIPTYNRSNKVINQLDFLKKEVVGFEDKINIYVSDNASDNEHSERLKEYSRQNKHFVLSIQNVNLGIMGNVKYLMDNSKSEFIWFLGDDDVLLDNIINNIFNILNLNHNIGYLFLNHDCFVDSIQNIVKKHDLTSTNGFTENAGVLVLDFLSKFGSINMFMSSAIYDRGTIIEAYRILDREVEFEDLILYSLISSELKGIYVCQDVYVYDNLTEISWSNNSRNVIHYGIPSKIIEFSKHFGHEKEAKSCIYNYYYNGFGNFLYLMIFSSLKNKLKILNFIGLVNSIVLLFNSLKKNVVKFLIKRRKFGNK